MILSRTPLTLSFFGGNPAQSSEPAQGVGLSAAITRYIDVQCRFRAVSSSPCLRLADYSRPRSRAQRDEDMCGAIRCRLNISRDVEVCRNNDKSLDCAPDNGGQAQDAAFTTGLLHALYGLSGRRPGPRRLAYESMMLAQEQGLARSAAHVTAACGGIQRVEFGAHGAFKARRVELSATRERALNAHLLLLAVHSRPSTLRGDCAERGVARPDFCLAGLADDALTLLDGRHDLLGLGVLMHEAWRASFSNSLAHEFDLARGLYHEARQMGATGGSLMEGGRLLLLCAPPDAHADITRSLAGVTPIPFGFEAQGSRLLRFVPDSDEAAPPQSTSLFLPPLRENAAPLYARAA